MNEHDANRALLEAVTLRLDMIDPLEQTQRMPVADRRYRQAEAKQQLADGVVDDAVRRQDWAITIAEPTELDRRARRSPIVTLTYRDFPMRRNRLMYRAPKLRTEAQEVDILRRWIYRAFSRKLYEMLAAYAPNRLPMNIASYQMILAICHNVLATMRPGPEWSVEIINPDVITRAQRMGPTVVLRYREQAV